MQRRTALDRGFDVENELLHARILVSGADDLERLHERNARREHGCELTEEDGDVLGLHLAAAAGARLLADLGRYDALTTQVGTQARLARGQGLARNAIAFLVHSLPDEGDVLFEC